VKKPSSAAAKVPPHQERKGSEVVPIRGGGVPAHLANDLDKHAGRGTSQAQEDNLVPLVYILQAQSPQLNRRNPAFIEGSEPGGIWLRNAADPVVPGEKGIIFQPCHFHKDWVEWIPRDKGGGFVARHADIPNDARRTEDPQNPSRVRFVRPNGNEVIETRYHVGLVHRGDDRMPYVIPLTSSGHTVSRTWMQLMNTFRTPGGKIAPSFARLYRLTTAERTNAAGTWFTWKVDDLGWVPTGEDFKAGAALADAAEAGTKGIGDPDANLREDPDSAVGEDRI
jgi:hypothetical protein